MPEKLIKKIRTSEGDLQIDYNALANLPDINKLEKDVKALEEILEDLPAGGGAISWNDLTDKPFGEEGRAPITWDGNIEGLPAITINGTPLVYKVSDVIILTHRELVGATFTMSDGTTDTLDEANLGGAEILDENKGVTIIGELYMLSVSDIDLTKNLFAESFGNDITVDIPETGTYFVYSPNFGYMSSLEFPGGIKTLDEKFIPDTIARVSPNPVSIDFSAFDTEGKIIEIFADSSTRTTTMEFDADGNPIKIIDADGNVTILTWGG